MIHKNSKIFLTGHLGLVGSAILRLLKSKGYKMAKYVSPHSLCYSKVGENSLIADHVSINPFSKIGFNNLCLFSTTIKKRVL